MMCWYYHLIQKHSTRKHKFGIRALLAFVCCVLMCVVSFPILSITQKTLQMSCFFFGPRVVVSYNVVHHASLPEETIKQKPLEPRLSCAYVFALVEKIYHPRVLFSVHTYAYTMRASHLKRNALSSSSNKQITNKTHTHRAEPNRAHTKKNVRPVFFLEPKRACSVHVVTFVALFALRAWNGNTSIRL